MLLKSVCILATTLSTGVRIPEGGVPLNNGGHQYTTRTERRPAAIATERDYLKWKWRMNLADPKTGLDNDGLRAGVKRICDESGWKAGTEDWYDVAARCFDFLVDNVQIGFSRFDCFPAISAWDRHARPMSAVLWGHAHAVDMKYSPDLPGKIAAVRRENRGLVGKDFDHSAPDWDDIFKIGFPGMKARIDAIDRDTPFHRAEKRTAAAILRFLDRLLVQAKAHPDADSPLMKKQIASLERLRRGPPQTCFDLMEFTMVYFILSEPLNYFQVRTMGNIDRLWWPYYQRDIAAGIYSESEFREDFRHFIWQFGSIDNYWGHPIYLGGVNLDGRAAYNPLSQIILDVVEKEALPTPKFQLKMGSDTPDAIWWKALDMIRRHCPLALMSEANMMESMKAVGLPEEDAKDLLIWGCFEWLPRGRGNCTSATRVILPQPITEIFASKKLDFPTFEDFKREYIRILHSNTDRIRELCTENERHLAEINPALVLSLAVPGALRKGVDAFSLGYDYNYTAIMPVGFATAVDSLLAVREFVYDRKELTLAAFGRILAADWRGHDEFRLKVRRSRLKWGCGHPEADALVKEVIESFTSRIVGTPNARGGKYVCYGLNSRGFIDHAWLPATPDGRRKGDHLSKNMAPCVGAETEGVTGSIRSFAAIAPGNFPCGEIYDIMIHPSAVGGVFDGKTPDKGLLAFRALVEQFYAQGGIALNINIVSPETLRDAQQHPEKYENLQVRVAGWNIRWNDIPKKEQDEYIARIETLAQ